MSLPERDGVAPSRLRLPDAAAGPLGDFLAAAFPRIDADEWRRRFSAGLVLDEQGRPLSWSSPCRPATLVHYYRQPPPETPLPFEAEILHHDQDLLVADKPHFLPVIPAGRFLRETLLHRLKILTGNPELTPVHRLDRDTAGLVLFSTRAASRAAYTALFQERRIAKIYHALAPWRPELASPLSRVSCLAEGQPFFRIAETPGPPNSLTRIAMLERRGDSALYQLEPVTGRKHQLRVHMAALGAPILGDPYYPDLLPEKADDDFSSPLQLLAQSLSFIDPLSGSPRLFTSRRQLAIL